MLGLRCWWPSPAVSLATRFLGTSFLTINGSMNSVYCTLLRPWNRFSKAQECESLLGWLSCFHSRTGHGIMHSSPREEESFTSQIPQVGVFSNKAITLTTSWRNFCNQSGPFKYSKTQSLLCFWLTCCYNPTISSTSSQKHCLTI